MAVLKDGDYDSAGNIDVSFVFADNFCGMTGFGTHDGLGGDVFCEMEGSAVAIAQNLGNLSPPYEIGL